MHRDQHSSIQMDGLEDDTIAAGDTHQFDQTLSSSVWLPSTWSERFGSAWPKLRRETAQPAMAAVRRGEAFPAVRLGAETSIPTR